MPTRRRRGAALGRWALDGVKPLERKMGVSLLLERRRREREEEGGGVAFLQSWTSNETLGLLARLFIFLLAGLVVITMTGERE
jgi:hypothetical protein